MFKKLARSQDGFGLHVILPLIAVLVVGAIGAYMQFNSNALVPPQGWTTIKSATGTWYINPYPSSSTSLSAINAYIAKGYKYRVCIYGSYHNSNGYGANNNSGDYFTVDGYKYPMNIGGTNATYCTGTITPSSSGYKTPVTSQNSGLGGYVKFTKVYWQKYY